LDGPDGPAFAHCRGPRQVWGEALHPVVGLRLADEMVDAPLGSPYRNVLRRNGVTNGANAGAIPVLDADAFTQREVKIELSVPAEVDPPSLPEARELVRRKFRLAATSVVTDVAVVADAVDYETRKSRLPGETFVRYYVEEVPWDAIHGVEVPGSDAPDLRGAVHAAVALSDEFKAKLTAGVTSGPPPTFDVRGEVLREDRGVLYRVSLVPVTRHVTLTATVARRKARARLETAG
ncbi:MAG TPA: hypothetical protein VHI93_05045, partial [Candidatus Thermoplasmatota archaeon]|nr:hypothetical protein [Candidatus Thermoplasmatota archaeon]